jgi:hypothetical protein
LLQLLSRSARQCGLLPRTGRLRQTILSLETGPARRIGWIVSWRILQALTAPLGGASDIAATGSGTGPTSMEDRIAEARGAQARIRQPSSENANESRCLVTMRPDPRNESGGGNVRLRTPPAECRMNADFLLSRERKDDQRHVLCSQERGARSAWSLARVLS